MITKYTDKTLKDFLPVSEAITKNIIMKCKNIGEERVLSAILSYYQMYMSKYMLGINDMVEYVRQSKGYVNIEQIEEILKEMNK